jgi:hypothetical protein
MVFPLQLLQLLVSRSRQLGAARVAQGAPVWAGTRASSAPLSRATAKSAGKQRRPLLPPLLFPPRPLRAPIRSPILRPCPEMPGATAWRGKRGWSNPTAAAASALWALNSWCGVAVLRRRQRRRRSSSSGSNQRSAHARAHVPSERKLQLQASRGLPLRLLAPTLVARAAAPLRAPPREQDRSRMFQLGTAVVEADGRTGGGDGRPRLRWRLLQRNRALMRLLQRGARIALGREGREGREGRSTPGKGLTRHRPARPRQSRPSLEPARSTVQAHAPTAS